MLPFQVVRVRSGVVIARSKKLYGDFKMKYLEILCVHFLAFIGLLALSFSSSSHAATVSDLLITEVMVNPLSVSDARGEWLELFNPTSESVDLRGITLTDSTNAGHTISSINSLLINPGDYFVLARNTNSTINGGFMPEYAYGSEFSLSNGGDEIIFASGNDELLRLDYGSGFASAGFSMELISDIMRLDNYAASTRQYGLGDWGTPGSAGSFSFSSVTPVPIPGAALLMSSGLVGLVGLGRQRKFRF